MGSKNTVQDFFKRFPNDDICLDHIMRHHMGNDPICPSCERKARFYRISNRRGYACQWCGHHVFPCVGTPFENSRTSLQLWFYAIFLFTMTRHGVSAKELQRQLGVTYKCAWRMGHELRKLAARADLKHLLRGHIEIDETLVGGRRKGGKRGRGSPGKTVVLGMVERGGALRTGIVPNVRKVTLRPIITAHVAKGSTVSTDELASYNLLTEDGYDHGTVCHSAGEYVRGQHHVNTIEGYWSIFKRSVRSTHIHISKKHMPKYLAVFQFRANHRHLGNEMFNRLLSSI
ncbi:MAG: IS1595 family transposase [Proteobacteria bacterium]|nr:IS1595 family transposase [Pseudomonadota bacterium]